MSMQRGETRETASVRPASPPLHHPLLKLGLDANKMGVEMLESVEGRGVGSSTRKPKGDPCAAQACGGLCRACCHPLSPPSTSMVPGSAPVTSWGFLGCHVQVDPSSHALASAVTPEYFLSRTSLLGPVVTLSCWVVNLTNKRCAYHSMATEEEQAQTFPTSRVLYGVENGKCLPSE